MSIVIGGIVNNPFTPNFGQAPLYIAGRSFLTGEIERALDRGLGDPALASILVGPRGTGKTALLSHLGSYAEGHGWIAVNVSCLPGMLQDILEQTKRRTVEFVEPAHDKKLSAISIGQLGGIEWERQEPPTQNWRSLMTDILEELAAHDVGLYITVDEVDSELDEMIELAAVYQLFIREGRNVGLLMAGLPYKVSALLRDTSVSFLRRASQYRLGRIADPEISTAFKSTVEAAGGVVDECALLAAVDATNGFPFMMQLVGFRSWENRDASNAMTLDSVEEGIAMAKADLENRILRPTLDELSDMDIAFLEAMLEDDELSTSEDIAKRLGKSPSYIATYRKRLLEQGIIELQGRSKLRIALPGVREYLPEYLS